MTSAQMVRVDQSMLEKCKGSFDTASKVNKRLAWAAANCNLISPAPVCGTLPLGCEVALSVVQIDARAMEEGGDTYYTGGSSQEGTAKYGLGKTSLNQIAGALGVDWDPVLSRRVDDGSDPYYCHYRAVGTVRGLDGTPQTLTGEKEMDLRDGSPQIDSLRAKLRNPKATIDNQLRELRLHILSHAETKAKLRAIRSLGIKTSYTKADLAKPFLMAKLMFTGRVPGNPALETRFAEMQAAQMMGGPRALYGAGMTAPSLPASHAPVHAPPPIGAVGTGDDDDFSAATPRQIVEAKTSPAPQQQRAPKEQAAPKQAPAQKPSAGGGGGGLCIPGGTEKNKPIVDASDGTLAYWHKRIGSSLEKGEVEDRFLARDQALYNAMTAELERRGGASAPVQQPLLDPDFDGASPPDDDDFDAPPQGEREPGSDDL